MRRETSCHELRPGACLASKEQGAPSFPRREEAPGGGPGPEGSSGHSGPGARPLSCACQQPRESLA